MVSLWVCLLWNMAATWKMLPRFSMISRHGKDRNPKFLHILFRIASPLRLLKQSLFRLIVAACLASSSLSPIHFKTLCHCIDSHEGKTLCLHLSRVLTRF